jgi:hypothetical protein
MIDIWYYNKDAEYTNDIYNKTLFPWEALIIQQYFKASSSIFVTAVGGGREVYNLAKLGYEVEGCEYNQKLCDYANKFLAREKIASKVFTSERDTCPKLDKIYDGIIIGWGAYTLIRGAECRINYLKEISKYLDTNGVILLSFWTIDDTPNSLNWIEKSGNMIATILNNPKVEKGDLLEPNFLHCFSRKEIEYELCQAGFKLDCFRYKEYELYGHAIGIKI